MVKRKHPARKETDPVLAGLRRLRNRYSINNDHCVAFNESIGRPALSARVDKIWTTSLKALTLINQLIAEMEREKGKS